MNASIPIVSGINSALITFKKKGDVYKKKCRESNGLMIVRRGKFRYFMGNETFVSDRRHVLIVPAGADYSLICDEDAETYVIIFSSDPFSHTILTFDNTNDLSEDAEFIISNIHGSTADLLSSMGRLYSILSKLFDDNQKEIPKIIKNGVEYIEQNLSDNTLTVEKAAKASEVSEVYFRRIFGEHFGVSPLTYIREKRMALAKRKMSDRSLTLECIACDCGYSSIYSFSAAFKKKEGISPSQYREKYGEL